MANDKTRVLKLLEEKGQDSTFREFKEVYDRFKDHPDAAAALRRGVDRQSKTVDSGSYCENPSRDYSDWWKKNDFFKKLDIQDDRVFLEQQGSSVLSRDFRKETVTLEKLARIVEQLAERVELLEKKLSSAKPPKPNPAHKL